MKLSSLLPKSSQAAGRLERKAGWYYPVSMSLSHVWRTKAGCPTEHDHRQRWQRNTGFCSRPDGDMAFYGPLHSITLVEHFSTFSPFVPRCGFDCDHSLDTWKWPALEKGPAPLFPMSCTFNQFTHTSNATISQLSYCPTLSSQSHDDNLKLSFDHWTHVFLWFI